MNLETKEIWKDIVGYEDMYQVSNLGNVRSLRRTIIRNNGRKQSFKERMLKHGKGSNGYLTVSLLKDGVQKTFAVHHLVASAFLNPVGECVNHKDGNKLNNDVSNLEWCTYSDNSVHAYRTGLKQAERRYGGDNPNAKAVVQCANGVIVKIWESMMDAQRAGFSMKSISNCCVHRSKSHKGYQWSYAEEFNK